MTNTTYRRISQGCQWIACTIAGILILLNAFLMDVPESVTVTGFCATAFFLVGFAVFWTDKPEPEKKFPEVGAPTPGFEFLKPEDKEWFWAQFHMFDGYVEDLAPERKHSDVGKPFPRPEPNWNDPMEARLRAWQEAGAPMKDGKVDWSRVAVGLDYRPLDDAHVEELRALLPKPTVEQLMEVNEREWKLEDPPTDYSWLQFEKSSGM